MNEDTKRIVQLETTIRNLRGFHGKLGEALLIATVIDVPGFGVNEQTLRLMRDGVQEQIGTFTHELREIRR